MRFGSWQKKTLVIKYSAEPKSSAFLHWSKKMKDNILPRICRTCGTSFLGGPRAFYCPECREERKKEQSKKYKECIKHGSIITLGSVIQCESCGCDIIKCSGLQRFCPQCAKKHLKIIDNKQSEDWNKKNKEKVKKYNKKARAGHGLGKLLISPRWWSARSPSQQRGGWPRCGECSPRWTWP